MISRRQVLLATGALVAGGVVYGAGRGGTQSSDADLVGRPALKMPPLLDASETGSFQLEAQSGETSFASGQTTPTIGFNQPYLGPVVRIKRGALRPSVKNTLSWPISSHWHGLIVPGEHDGGPHHPIAPGKTWSPQMEIAQDPCTAFYHTHVHGRTARDVYAGLAGILHVVDGRDGERALPHSYGVDDITLVLQDRRISNDGQFEYANSMMDIMHGMTGDTIVVNGQVGAVAKVPKAIVRLRLINASNARTYSLYMSDNRPMHLIATDGGYLPAPASMQALRLGSGERAEILVDFSDGRGVSIMSEGDPNAGMGGMMGRMRGMFDSLTGARRFEVLPLQVDARFKGTVDRIPDTLGGEAPALHQASISKTRYFTLDMGMGGMMGEGMMGGRGMGGMMGGFAINGQPFDMDTINEKVNLGDTERWIVSADMLAHPFHIHGVSFQVVRENGDTPLPESRGWKDTVMVETETELLVRFTKPANDKSPFMYHCHILEHEDGGMMGQFTVG